MANVLRNLPVLRTFMEQLIQMGFSYIGALVGEFRPRRPFSTFFVSRVCSRATWNLAGFTTANASLCAQTMDEPSTQQPYTAEYNISTLCYQWNRP